VDRAPVACATRAVLMPCMEDFKHRIHLEFPALRCNEFYLSHDIQTW
jgi:hypothetical protein